MPTKIAHKKVTRIKKRRDAEREQNLKKRHKNR